MKKLFLIPFIILFFAYGAWAQQSLYVDTIADPSTVLKLEVDDNGDVFDGIYEVIDENDTRVLDLINYPPGRHLFKVQVWSIEQVIVDIDPVTGDTISITVWPSAPSGWSNILDITKPDILELSIVDGYLVTPYQPDIESITLHIGSVEFPTLDEATPDLQYIRIIAVSDIPAGANDFWAFAEHITLWHGDFPVNPTVVTVMDAPPNPVNLHLGIP